MRFFDKVDENFDWKLSSTRTKPCWEDKFESRNSSNSSNDQIISRQQKCFFRCPTTANQSIKSGEKFENNIKY